MVYPEELNNLFMVAWLVWDIGSDPSNVTFIWRSHTVYWVRHAKIHTTHDVKEKKLALLGVFDFLKTNNQVSAISLSHEKSAK